MNRLLPFALSFVTGASLLAPSPIFAAKPAEVIERSNGFPSGPHFNLNIHGKGPNFICDSTPGGNSVFVPAYGPSIIQYVSNKRSSLTELTVLDPCGFGGLTDDPAIVQLPTKIFAEDGLSLIDTASTGGYYVFGRILSKPNNGRTDIPSSILVSQSVVLQACNEIEVAVVDEFGDPILDEYGDPITTTEPVPGDYVGCDLALGLVTVQDIYTVNADVGFTRFDPTADQAKGKSVAKDITPLFTWSGWVCDPSLDSNADGVIDLADLPLTIDGDKDWDNDTAEPDPVGDIDDLYTWLALFDDGDPLTTSLATYYENEWIFNIAELVVAGQTLNNDGTKLFQIRFYPVATTVFTP